MASNPAIFRAKKELGFAPCSSLSIIGPRLPRRALNKALAVAVVGPARYPGAPSAGGPVKHAMTMTEKILARASKKSHLEPGENVWVNVDVLMTHDVCGPGTIGIFKKEFGQNAQVWDREKIVIIPDHYIFTSDERANRNVDILRDFCLEQNIKYFYDTKDLSNFKVNPDYKGVCHIALAQEGHCRPGEVLLGTDSHTCNAGAFGQFATGIGNADAVFVMGAGKLLLKNMDANQVAVTTKRPLMDVSPTSAFVVPPLRKLQPDELANNQLFQENTPSVVHIANLGLRQDAFTGDVLEVPQGSGSGLIWDTMGRMITSYHVIHGASKLRVTLADQTTYEAKVVGYDLDKDVAVLRIDAPKEKLRPITVGISSNLLVGQKGYVIGSPYDLRGTFTPGVISGLGREIPSPANGQPIHDAIQIDASINPGNSGSPLLDSSGCLIGIITAIYSPSGASCGVGFAIPVDTVKGIVSRLL